MAERKVPRIRFKGFEEDWEQRKLGELAFITTGKLDANAAKKDGEYNFFTCGKEILKTNSYAFDGEAILINGNGDLGYTRKYVGKFNAYQRTYVLQGFVMDYEYIEHAIHKFLPDKIKNESIGGAMPYIKIDSLMNLELPIPVVQEAVAVTRFLNELDSLLSLHQRKLEKLKILKKAMLEKMFPKNGAKVPEIRFSGFTDDWEQRKFSDLYEKSSEKNDGSIGVDRNITVASMQFKTDVRVNTVEYLKTYYTFRLGDIAFEGHQSKEFRFGRFVENDIGDGIVSHIFVVFRPVGHYDLRYWKYAINNEKLMQHVLSRSTKASTMMHDLVEKDFLNESLLVPSFKEQQSIGEFLFFVDRSISLHQRKLEKLRQIKKSMLERMFV